MGKVIKKKLNGMSWWMKASLVLLLTIATTMFMYQGWYKPMKAEAVTQAQAWSSLYSGIAVPGTLSYTVNAGSNRLLVVAVSSTMGGTAGAQTVSATYGGQSMTVVGNTASARAHSYLLYLKDSGITAATNTNLIINLSGTTTSNYVYAAVYTSVDQTTPVSSTASWFSSASQSSIGPFSPAFSIAANDQAVEIVNVMRSASGTAARTISTWATGWAGTFTPPAVNDSAAGWYTTMYVKDRTLLTANAADTSQHSASSASTFSSMNAISIHDYTVTDVTPPVEGTLSITPSDGTYTSATPTISMGFTDADSTITGCQYSINSGGSFAAATWTAGTNTCSQTLATQTNGTTLNIQMKATSAGGTSVPSVTLTRTVDTTGPTDGTLSITSGSGLLKLDWTAATPTGSALNATTPYDVRYLAGGTAPSCSTGTSLYTGTALTFTHNGLTNGSTYSYRVCAYDIFNNPSIGTNASGIPAANPAVISSCTACHFNTTPVTANAGKYDGTGRNVPVGLFQGSHDTHANTGTGKYGYACTDCHANNTDYGHATGVITMASPIHNTGGSYSRIAPINVSNTFSPGTCSGTYCHSDGTGGTINGGDARGIVANTSPTWGNTITNCYTCHGTLASKGAPAYANYTGTAAVINGSKANAHAGTTHASKTCDTCHSSVTTADAGVTYTPNTAHNDGLYSIQASLGYGTFNSRRGGTCATPGCHSAVNWGGKLTCLDCHSTAINAPIAAALLPALTPPITQRRAVVPEFNNASNAEHLRTRVLPLDEHDCGVCHMEGDAGTGSTTSYHQNGYVELRDPQTGTTIKTKTFTYTAGAPGSYSADTADDAKFVRFSRDLSKTLEAETGIVYGSVTNFQVLAGIQVNHCLKCHSSTGASHASARIAAAGTKVLQPFNNASTAVNVSSQLATTNRSYHPVLGRNNNSYTQGTRMVAPWNMAKTNANTTSWGYLLSCWDCHCTNGSTSTTTITATVTAHGSARTVDAASNNSVELRGRNWTTGSLTVATSQNTFCIKCHALYDTSTTTNHSTGSAFSNGGSSSMSQFLRYGCTYCHSSNPQVTIAKRRTRSGDVHGYNTNYDGTALSPAATKGFAFIRNTVITSVPKSAAGTAYTTVCFGATAPTGSLTNGTTSCGLTNMGANEAYSIGGTY